MITLLSWLQRIYQEWSLTQRSCGCREHNFPNAWLASVPGHPLWLYVIMEIIRSYQKNP